MKAILACEKNGGIGYKGSMPWPKQEKDLARFKELTLNTTILMGRGTWESTGMPKPLPNRVNVVLSTSDIEHNGSAIHIKSEDEIDTLVTPVDWVIGGAGLVESLWDRIDEFHLSHLRQEYECDTHLDLTKLKEDFKLVRSQMCLTHNYEIWQRR